MYAAWPSVQNAYSNLGRSLIHAIGWATNDDVLRNGALRGHPSDQAMNHEIEPEDVQADEAAHEGVEHVQRAILHVLTQAVIALLLQAPNHMGREEPETEIHPANNHKAIEHDTDDRGEDIDGQFEKGNSQVGHIVQNHYCGSDGQHVEGVREENEGPGHQMVKHVLREIWPRALYQDSVGKLIEMIS